MIAPSSPEFHWFKRAKRLTHGLIISGALNVGFLATFISFALQKQASSTVFEHPPSVQERACVSNAFIFEQFSSLSFENLLLKLESSELAEDGFSQRDLALGCLVAFHHFNLERALGGIPFQKRKVSFSKGELVLFPGIEDSQFEAILHYAKTEKWPLTGPGLFAQIKKKLPNLDLSLLDAFYLTPEFYAVSTLFWKSGLALDKTLLVQLIAQGDWEMLEFFTEQQRLAQDLTPDRRRLFLFAYFNAGSLLAGELLVEHERAFICRRLTDTQILHLLEVITVKTPHLESLAKDLLLSPRSDAVHQKAALKLYAFASELMPTPYDHRAALLRFIPETVVEKPSSVVVSRPVSAPPPQKTVTPAPKKKIHVVQDGENLWKIARRYQVTVEALKKTNHLESDRLRPGKQLEIPEKSSSK